MAFLYEVLLNEFGKRTIMEVIATNDGQRKKKTRINNEAFRNA